MNKKILALISLLLVPALLLAGCTSATASWPNATVNGENVYIAAGSFVYAVSLQNHEQVWQFPDKASTANPFYAAPGLSPDGKQLIVGGYDKKLYSLDPQTGKTLWTFDKATDRYIAGPLVTDSMIYAPNADYNLYALDLSGNLQWSFSANQALWGSPVSDGTNVYFGTLGKQVYALNAATGKSAWAGPVAMDGAVLGVPAVDAADQTLLVATYSGTIYALNTADGKVSWSKKTGSWFWSGPVLSGPNLYIGDGDGTLWAFTASNGQELWSNGDLQGSIIGGVLVAGDSLVVGTDVPNGVTGYVYFIDAKTGKISEEISLLTKSTNGQVYSSPVASKDIVLVGLAGGSKDPVLLAYDTAGKYQWSFDPNK